MVIGKLMKRIGSRRAGAVKPPAPPSVGGRVTLDYPQQGEKITTPGYSLRAGTVGDVEKVEISLNQGPWLACRYSVGYWWYDWCGYAEGRQQAEVRAYLRNGNTVSDGPVRFQVAFPSGRS